MTSADHDRAPAPPAAEQPDAAEAQAAGAATAPLALMITRRQRERLAALGHTAEGVRHMTPAEAHALLGAADAPE